MSQIVLLLSGDTADIRSLTMTLQAAQWEVVRCSNSDALFERLAKNPRPTVLIGHLRAKWAQLSGVFRQVRASEGLERLPILVIGDRKETGNEDAIKNAGVWPEDIFAEPVDTSALLERLGRIRPNGEEPPVKITQAISLSDLKEMKSAMKSPGETHVDHPPVIPERGSLKTSTPARLLATVMRERQTGSIYFLFPEMNSELFVKEGVVTWLDSDGDFSLKSWLVRKGKVPAARVFSLAEDAGVDKFLAAGVISPHLIIDLLQDRLHEFLQENASARTGDYRWYPGESTPVGSFPLQIKPMRKLLDGMLSSPPVALPLTEGLLAAIPVITEEGKEALANWGLLPPEVRILRNVDSNRPIETLVSDTVGMSPDRIRWAQALIIGLRDLGALQLRPPSRTVARPVVNPPPPRQPEVGHSTPSSSSAPSSDPLVSELVSELARVKAAGDPWAVLGVTLETPEDECRRVFTQLTKRYHPDKFFSASEDIRSRVEELTRHFNDAWAVVSAPALKAAYKKGKEAGTEHPITEEDESRARIAATQAELYIRNRNFVRARELFDEARSLNPLHNDYAISSAWAAFLADPQEGDRAIATLHVLLKKEPKHARGFYFLGMVLKSRNDMAQAEKAFERALHLKADLVDAERELRLLKMRREKDSDSNESGKKGGLFGLFKRR